MKPAYCLAHLSDLHLTQPHPHLQDLASKRLLGYLSWQLKRRHEHRSSVLAALTRDLAAQPVDHVVLTGDLTQIGLPDEFRQVRDWLETLGRPENVTLIPGNHDRYVSTADKHTMALWRPYYQSDDGGHHFPCVRERGPTALIGVDSAPPTAPFLATGSVGARQCRELAEVLQSERKHFRVVLIHHPPHPEAVKFRKRLVDATRVSEVLYRHGCGLVLHGHSHQWQLHWLSGPYAPIPTLGVPSASALGHKQGYRARYHCYRISRTGDRWRVGVEIRGFRPDQDKFVHEGRFELETRG